MPNSERKHPWRGFNNVPSNELKEIIKNINEVVYNIHHLTIAFRNLQDGFELKGDNEALFDMLGAINFAVCHLAADLEERTNAII